MAKQPEVALIKDKLKEQKEFQQVSPMCNHFETNPDFTGIARSVKCYLNNGHNNFQILTLHVEKGKVVKCDYSDPYANFEAIARLELWNELAMINLNLNWKEGETFKK